MSSAPFLNISLIWIVITGGENLSLTSLHILDQKEGTIQNCTAAFHISVVSYRISLNTLGRHTQFFLIKRVHYVLTAWSRHDIYRFKSQELSFIILSLSCSLYIIMQNPFYSARQYSWIINFCWLVGTLFRGLLVCYIVL